MIFGVPKESEPGETRIAMVPDTVKGLAKKGHSVLIQSGAGESAFIPDKEFEAAGAKIVADAAAVFAGADCILKVQPPNPAELERLRANQGLISFLWHLRNPDLVRQLAKAKVTSFSMDAIPRITRAQSMDALSSMSTISGYKAVLLAAQLLPKFFPMLTTAAGTVRPAQGLILGAGVAGLQAIATARRLGAVVEAFDARPVVKEQVLSLGATFVELGEKGEPGSSQDKYGYAKEASEELLAKQRALIHERVKLADFVITTAQIPGRPAPLLVTKAMVQDMKPGSVIVDLAGETGGNCELTKANETIVQHRVTITAPTNLPATMPLDSSRMYARNLATLIAELVSEKGFTFDWNNEVFRETCITNAGEIKKGEKK
ncbi:MAG: Re/Si-specific NAD(P)(+) transhydrogenase subunit alpha [Deltaproteobacteria bacterium]|nr:Re/Si-specific NAD(P)(+) transhydrogenase subunit alpha [Deltaproteobacteria bacterium]